MKKILQNLIFSLAMLGILFIMTGSCKKEDSTRDSINNSTWDARIMYSSNVSWHADITFNEDGTYTYDQPSDPGYFLNHGTWTLDGDVIKFGVALSPYCTFTGTVSGNTIKGTYSYTTGTKDWSAVKK
jgi:hypothetical protein